MWHTFKINEFLCFLESIGWHTMDSKTLFVRTYIYKCAYTHMFIYVYVWLNVGGGMSDGKNAQEWVRNRQNMTHSYVCHDSYHSCVCHEPWHTCETHGSWHTHESYELPLDITKLIRTHGSWHTHESYDEWVSLCLMATTHKSEFVTGKTWLIHMCAMTHMTHKRTHKSEIIAGKQAGWTLDLPQTSRANPVQCSKWRRVIRCLSW